MSFRLFHTHKRCPAAYRSLFLGVFLLPCSPLWSAGEPLSVGARHQGLAGACAAFGSGPEQLFYNPGLVRSGKQLDFIFSHTRLYGTDIVHQAAAGVVSLDCFSIGTGIQTLGTAGYSEKNLVMAGCVRLDEKYYLGIGVRRLLIDIEKYGHDGVFITDAGFLVRLSDQFQWGGLMKNINHAVIGRSKEKIFQSISTGLTVSLLPHVTVCVDVVKDDYSLPDLRSGFEYEIFRALNIRFGVGNRPARFCAGFSLTLYRFRLDYGFQSHSELGFTNYFSVGF